MSHAPVHQLCCTCRATLSQLPAPCQSSPCTAVCLTIGDHRWTAAIASAVRHLLGAFISAASTADSTCAMLAAKALLPQPDGPPAQPWRVTMLNCTKTCLGRCLPGAEGWHQAPAAAAHAGVRHKCVGVRSGRRHGMHTEGYSDMHRSCQVWRCPVVLRALTCTAIAACIPSLR